MHMRVSPLNADDYKLSAMAERGCKFPEVELRTEGEDDEETK